LFHLGFALRRTSRETGHRDLRPKLRSGTVREKCKNRGVGSSRRGLFLECGIMAAIGGMETVEEEW
jgi:hypothetical protein